MKLKKGIILLLTMLFLFGCTNEELQETPKEGIDNPIEPISKTETNTQDISIQKDSTDTPAGVEQKKVEEEKPPAVKIAKMYTIPDVYSFVQKKPNFEEKDSLIATLESSDCGLRKLATAVLFKYDESYEEELFDEFAIRDYFERQNGRYNYVDTDFVSQIIEGVEVRYPEYDSTVHSLYTFCEVQEKNYWQAVDNRKISVARLFRGAFLAQILEPQIEDITPLLGKIDEKTQKEQLG